MNRKGFVNTVLVFIIVILIGAVGYFVLIRKPTATTQRPTSTGVATDTQTTAVTSVQRETPSLSTVSFVVHKVSPGFSLDFPTLSYRVEYPSKWKVVSIREGHDTAFYYDPLFNDFEKIKTESDFITNIKNGGFIFLFIDKEDPFEDFGGNIKSLSEREQYLKRWVPEIMTEAIEEIPLGINVSISEFQELSKQGELRFFQGYSNDAGRKGIVKIMLIVNENAKVLIPVLLVYPNLQQATNFDTILDHFKNTFQLESL